MNTTGCANTYAQDRFFAMGAVPAPGECTFSIPFYAVYMSLAVLMMAMVAIRRTTLIIDRVRFAKKHSRRGKCSMVQVTTMAASWLAVLIHLAILIVPLTYGDANNVMVFLLGIQVFVFQIGSIKWSDKLIRLGSRIIGSKLSSKPSDSHEESEDPLRKHDTLLRVLGILIRAVALFQVICWCIFSLVFPSEKLWFLLGSGMLAISTLGLITLIIYQYQRCKMAIYAMNARIEANVLVKDQSTMVAVSKFTKHQLIQLFGVPCIVLFLLWAVEVIPRSYAYMLVCVGCDVLVNGSMLVTFLASSAGKANKGSRDEGSNKVVAAAAAGNKDEDTHHHMSKDTSLNESKVDASLPA